MDWLQRFNGRKLIRYLAENTNNQYFISTHSSVFMDTPDATIFRVRNDGQQTYVDPAIKNNEKNQVLDDLGYRGSDILLSNFVIWVEGPSDRIYLRHWIETQDCRLKEREHYTIMSYGGSLIKELGFNEEVSDEEQSIEEFINVLKLGRKGAIVMDSDRKLATDREKAKEEISKTVERIQQELEENKSLIVWITEGCEIENYIKYDVLHEKLDLVHPKIYGKPIFENGEDTQFRNTFHFYRRNSEEIFKKAKKVKLAHRVVKHDGDFCEPSLKNHLDEKVNQIVNGILEANGIEKS